MGSHGPLQDESRRVMGLDFAAGITAGEPGGGVKDHGAHGPGLVPARSPSGVRPLAAGEQPHRLRPALELADPDLAA